MNPIIRIVAQKGGPEVKIIRSHEYIDLPDTVTASGFTISMLPDFHNGDHEEILRLVGEDAPDIIMIPGDVILGYLPDGCDRVIDKCANVIPFLEGCAEIAPTYMSLGNHECLLTDDELEEIRKTGVTLLDNEWCETFMPGGDQSPENRLLIGGLTSAFVLSYRSFRDQVNRDNDGEQVRYPSRRPPRSIGRFPSESSWLDGFTHEDGYRILLCHHPEYWSMRDPMIIDRKIDLVLSGHAHGGQWRIFGRGIYSPGQGLFPRFTSGIHRGPFGNMVVSRGLHNPYASVPRFGNPCEIVYIHLRGQNPQQ